MEGTEKGRKMGKERQWERRRLRGGEGVEREGENGRVREKGWRVEEKITEGVTRWGRERTTCDRLFRPWFHDQVGLSPA